MDLFLTILKFAGIIVSGALGVLGTVTDTRNKRTGKLTNWGKWALWLTILGFGVALGSQVFESVEHKNEELESRERMEEQIRLSAQSLQHIERMDTRFDSVSAEITCELSSNNPVFKPLFDYFVTDAKLTPAVDPDSVPASNAVYSANVVGYVSTVTNTPPSGVSTNVSRALSRQEMIDLNWDPLGDMTRSDLAHEWNINGSGVILRPPALATNFPWTPWLSISLYSTQAVSLGDFGLSLLLTNFAAEPEVMFWDKPKTLKIKWTYNVPRSSWLQKKQMGSLVDLADAPVYFAFLNLPASVSDGMKPRRIDLKFDDTTLSVANLHQAVKYDGRGLLIESPGGKMDTFTTDTNDFPYNSLHVVSWYNLYGGRLPGKDEILEGRSQ